ncbi:MAG: Ohr subfamily peroxiredoxin [Actinobacteria bacterium]|jgi:osmotically inducible protein OsmC|nr:organic hydroperoxide resistance protein [Actinomycetota bacterium]PLS87732.1 MAG: Ohr subfamily peroxiredoxin [Actinomycetota bacterium]
MKTVYYTASATTSGGRNGHVESSDGVLDLDLTMPKEMGGEGGSATNPEQLFAAGYSACFENALRMVAGRQNKDVGDASITANVGIGQTEDGGFGLAVELIGHLPDLPREEAQALMEEAHQMCPYSRATRGNIDVKLSVDLVEA